MKRAVFSILLVLPITLGWSMKNFAANLPEDEFKDEKIITIKDPAEKINRKVFSLNNKIYDYGLKPPAKVWRKIIPSKVRKGVDRGFKLYAEWPMRIVNSVLQLKAKDTIVEIVRPIVDLPFLGSYALSEKIGLKQSKKRMNFDSTLKKWNVPYGCYLVWPLFGPNSVRGTIGKIVDGFANPLCYFLYIYETAAVVATNEFNRYSMDFEQYEDFNRAALDYYLAVRNAYFQKTEPEK